MSQSYQQRTFFDKTKSLNDGLTQLIFAILKIIGLIGAVILLGGVGWVAYICYTNPNESIVVGLLLVLSLSVAWQVRKSRAGEANNDLPPLLLQLIRFFLTTRNLVRIRRRRRHKRQKLSLKRLQRRCVHGLRIG